MQIIFFFSVKRSITINQLLSKHDKYSTILDFDFTILVSFITFHHSAKDNSIQTYMGRQTKIE